MLKAELHIHTKEDPEDGKTINYTAKELIDEAALQGFEVLAFTCHNKMIHSQELEDYARSKNIFLIPGVERTVQGKHVLIYNLTEEESREITSLEKLEELKQRKKELDLPFLVVAPHPFHWGFTCLKNQVLKNLNLFDAWEYSFFYLSKLNKNKKTLKLSQKYQKPLVGNSDVHQLESLGKTYTLIDAEKNLNSVFRAIKENRLEVKTEPLSLAYFSKVFMWALTSGFNKSLKQ